MDSHAQRPKHRASAALVAMALSVIAVICISSSETSVAESVDGGVDWSAQNPFAVPHASNTNQYTWLSCDNSQAMEGHFSLAMSNEAMADAEASLKEADAMHQLKKRTMTESRLLQKPSLTVVSKMHDSWMAAQDAKEVPPVRI